MIYFNNTSAFTSVYFGNTEYSKVYTGVYKIWPVEEPPTPTFDGKLRLTYSNGEVYEIPATGSTTVRNSDITGGPQAKENIVSVEFGSYARIINSLLFYNHSGLTSVTIYNGVTDIKTSAFEGCTSLSEIEISDSVTNIQSSVFAECSGLTSIDIPSGVTSIGTGVFHGCSGLTSIDIPSGVTSIGDNSFGKCSNLSSVIIPSGVTSIGSYTFINCTNLASITVETTTPPTLGRDPFNATNNCPIYVPSQSVETYKTAWSDYASRIQAIP